MTNLCMSVFCGLMSVVFEYEMCTPRVHLRSERADYPAIIITHLENDSLVGCWFFGGGRGVYDGVSVYLLPDGLGDGRHKEDRVQVKVIAQDLCKLFWCDAHF